MNIAFVSTAHIHTRSFIDNILKAQDGRRVYRVWDDAPDRGQRYAESAQASFTSDLNEVVQDPRVDGFIICAENTRHLPLLQKVLPAGKPVFCEKPLVTSTRELEQVQALLKQHPVPLFCGYFQPFSAQMQGIARLLEEKAFGRITHVRFRNAHHASYGRWFDNPDLQWFTDPELAGGGAFMDLGTHAVHLLRSLFGPVKEAWAHLANVSGNYGAVDDTGVAHLIFESGAIGTVEASWVQTGGINGLEITGSEQSLWHNGKEYLVGSPGKDAVPVTPAQERPTRVDRLAAAIAGDLTREELEADRAATLDAVRIMDAAYKSSRTGEWTRDL
jgi:predicted dehydrogenase